MGPGGSDATMAVVEEDDEDEAENEGKRRPTPLSSL